MHKFILNNVLICANDLTKLWFMKVTILLIWTIYLFQNTPTVTWCGRIRSPYPWKIHIIKFT